MEGEKKLRATSISGEGDVQRQQLRTEVELNKQRLHTLQEVIAVKMRARYTHYLCSSTCPDSVLAAGL